MAPGSSVRVVRALRVACSTASMSSQLSERSGSTMASTGSPSSLGLGAGLPQPADRHDVLVGGARASAHHDFLRRAAAQAGRCLAATTRALHQRLGEQVELVISVVEPYAVAVHLREV